MLRALDYLTGFHLYRLMPPYKARSIRLTLISTWLVLLITVASFLLFEILEIEIMRLYRWHTVPFILLYCIALLCFRAKKFLVSKVIFFLTGLIQLAAICLFFGKATGVDYFFTLSMVFPFFIFDRDERGWLRVSLLLFLIEVFSVQILMESYPPVIILQPEINDMLKTTIVIITLLVILLPSYYFHGLAGEAETKLEAEQVASDLLLQNTLPEKIAKELKDNGVVQARYHHSTTVLFTDFVNFSSIAAQLDPRELIEILDSCFSAFDKIVSSYGIEKLKTIGDAYMAVAGIPEPISEHAVKTVKAAIKMRGEIKRLMQKRLRAGKPAWYIRIGIHSGPLIAGVIGENKFSYDVWGNTVNVASRMETNGEPGRINISEETYELVKHQFKCQARGERGIKGLGRAPMYFVTGWKT